MTNPVFGICVGVLLSLGAQAGPLRVVTATRDLADFVQQVGGEHVSVQSLVSGLDDTHNVLMKPSMVTMLARADLFIEMGLDMEHGYAPGLLAESRNHAIQPGAPGFLDASRGIPVLGVPGSLDRGEGDVHAQGNPHWNLDPERAKIAVRNIAAKLAELDSADAAAFAANAERYIAELDARIREWRARLDGKDIRFVSYHAHFAYFAQCFALKEVGTIQPKAGIEPGPRAMAELMARMSREGANLVVRESFFSDRYPKVVAQRTGARLVAVPIQVGGMPGADTYIAMIDMLVTAFAGDQ
ncbi:MAG: metal ABC transporter substrate-binding protein [Lentisphaerae bacterium]|nr:metal ABC transporter substrate-binding protein [Lentisphaerota bacterium]